MNSGSVACLPASRWSPACSLSSRTIRAPRKQGQIDVAALSAAVAHEEDHVTALELAAWIRDRKPGLRVIDLRPAADFETYHVPGAQRVAIESPGPATFQPDEALGLISDGGAHAAQAWVYVRAMRHRNVYFLRGGINEWLEGVMPDARSQEGRRGC
jgi:rhodanese-related sulfurtransferase